MKSVVEKICFFYFVSHIVITLTMDIQFLLHEYFEIYLPALAQVFKDYGRDFDPLSLDRPIWIKSMIFVECIGQLPFFPIASIAFYKGVESIFFQKWKTGLIIYSTHVATTMIPILGYLLLNYSRFTASQYVAWKYLLNISVYSIYLIIPLTVLYICVQSRGSKVKQ